MKAGIAFVPEDRKADGLLEESIRTIRPREPATDQPGFPHEPTAGEARDLMHRRTCRRPRRVVGREPAKVVRAVARDPEVLLDEPRGVDIGAKEETIA